MQSRVNYIYLLLSILFQSVAFILSKFAALDMQSNNLFLLLFNSYYLLALFCLMLQAVFWQLVLRSVDLSIAYPLTALNNVFILIFSYMIFNEHITFNNILGVSIIMMGIVIQNIKSGNK